MHTLARKFKKPPHTGPSAARVPVRYYSNNISGSQRANIRNILSGNFIQPKLTIGQPDDQYEQEADQVADQVMQMPDTEVKRQSEPEEEEEEQIQTKPIRETITPLLQRMEVPEEEEEQIQGKPITENISPLLQREESPEEEQELQTKLIKGKMPSHIQRMCSECEEEVKRQPEEETEDEEQLQTKQQAGSTSDMSAELESDIHSLKGAGQPLPESSRSFFEPRFGHDFGNIRVHTDTRANRLARSINARAFTLSNNIVFGPGEYQPHSGQGKRLMAHELTHTIQQGDSIFKNKNYGVQCQDRKDILRRAVTETKRDTHAGLFELARHNKLGGPTFAPQSQYDVRLEFQPYKVVDCDEIGMTQSVISFTGGVLQYGSAARRNRSLTAAEGTAGVGIDRLSGRTSPLYGVSNAGAAGANAQFGKRTGNNKGTKAWIEDSPGFSGAAGSSRTAGVTDAMHFETCAICNKGTDQGVYYGCVNWGYSIDASNNFTEDNFALVSKGTPSADFIAAAKKWNAQVVPAVTDDLPVPAHTTKQVSMTEAQLKTEITALKATLTGLAAGHADIPQITFEIKVYEDFLKAMSYNDKQGYHERDIKAIQAVVGRSPNGNFDFETIAKIKKWQVGKGLHGDGRFGSKSKKKFDDIVKAAVTANKAKGFTVAQIKKIQVEVGAKDDGFWGEKTVKHLMAWQANKILLTATGKFNLATRLSMFGLGGF